MYKPITWSSFAENDFAGILEYLYNKWNVLVVNDSIFKTEKCMDLIQKNPEQFPLIHLNLQIRKCVVTKHNAIYYRENFYKIEILRVYDTRQNPESLKF